MNEQRRRTASRCGAAVVAVVALSTVAACGSSSSRAADKGSSTSAAPATTSSASSPPGAAHGLTATTITVGQLADVSGPEPGLFTGAVNGLDGWAAYVNSTGGIDGRKVIIDHKDSALSCNTYTNGLKAFTTSVFASLGSYSGVDVCGIAALKSAPTFPDLQAEALSPSLYSLPNVYSPSPNPPGYVTTPYLYLKNKFGAGAVAKSAGLYGSPEVASFNEQSAAAKSVGFKYVYSRGFGNTETNFTSDVLRMKSEGIEIVDMIDAPYTAVANFLQQSSQQGFHPDAVLSASPYDSGFLKVLGDPSYAAPLIINLPWSLYLGGDAASVPEIKTMTTWVNKTHPGSVINLFTVEAWASGLLFQEAMAKAGTKPSQAGLLQALKGITSFNANGLIAPTNPGQQVGARCFAFVGVKNDKFTRLDPPDKGFLCNGTFVPYKVS